MDPMVSARVPAEVRDQVNAALKSLGVTPTEFINRAYEAFLTTKELPKVGKPLRSGKRTLNKRQQEELSCSLAKTTVAIPEAYFQGKSYDQLLEDALRADYEALA